MRVFVDNKETGPLTHDQWKEAPTLLPDIEAAGYVLNVDEAIAARWRLARFQGTVCSVIVVVGMFFVLLIGGARGENGIYVLGPSVAAIAVIYAICLSLVPGWKIGLAEWYVGLPEAHTPIRADSAGLMIGDVVASWEELSAQALYLTNDSDGEAVLKRLTLSGPFADVSLDPVLIENGQNIVGYVFRRICPEPPKEKR